MNYSSSDEGISSIHGIQCVSARNGYLNVTLIDKLEKAVLFSLQNKDNRSQEESARPPMNVYVKRHDFEIQMKKAHFSQEAFEYANVQRERVTYLTVTGCISGIRSRSTTIVPNELLQANISSFLLMVL